MAATLSLQVTKWMLDLASRLVKARVRLHNLSAVPSDAAIVFTANHFTRLETLLLPYLIHHHTGLEPCSLASDHLFRGRVGAYLRATGAVSTRDPDRDSIIIRALLRGDHPWIIFPEGAMIKDKKVLAENGHYEVFDGAARRPPHTGAAALALRAAFYRAKIKCLAARDKPDDMQRALELFKLDNIDEVVAHRTLIIPVNITYYPIRARENIFLRAAKLATPDLSERALSELSVEGTVLAEDTDIDIVFGEPMDVDACLDKPEFASLTACGLHDLDALTSDTRATFRQEALRMTERFLSDIYGNTTINIDHVFAGLIRRQPEGRILTERDYRERLFLCAQQILGTGCRVHPDFKTRCAALLDDEFHAPFSDFLRMAVEEGFLTPSGGGYCKTARQLLPVAQFHAMPLSATPEVIANEVESAHLTAPLLRPIAWAPTFLVKTALRRHLVREDMRDFETDYARHYDPSQSKPPDVGKPFLLRPWRLRGGVVLAHGYMAAPLEVRALAEHLYRAGFAVYGVRLRGHGTVPEDLARQTWQDWQVSVNRGYAIMRSLTDTVILGGFSTGGCLAMLAASHKGDAIKGVFSICAPLSVRNYSIRLVPSIVSLNTLLKRLGQSQYAWEYVENDPENKHINYARNPLTGVKELTAVMTATSEALPEVAVPALVIQASKDTTVDPSSGSMIFEKLGSRNKQLTLFERERHGIINGEGAADIFAHVEQFLLRTTRQARSERYWLFGRRVGQWLFGGRNHAGTSTPGPTKNVLEPEDAPVIEHGAESN